MTTNQIAYFSAKEQQRHNLMTEQETGRHNVETESIQQETNSINRTHLQTMDAETQRHNIATEGIQRAQLDLGERTLAETVRHNKVNENVSYLTIQESQRHNLQSEQISYAQINETSRHNKAEEEQARKNAISQWQVNDSLISKNRADTNLTTAKTAQQHLYNDMTKVDAMYYQENAYSKAMEQRAEANKVIKDESWYGYNQYLKLLGSITPFGGLALGY